MDTANSGNDSGSSEKQLEKWLQKVADLQAEARALRAQLSVVRGLVVATLKYSRRTDENEQPCWCEERLGLHEAACTDLQRLVRALEEQLVGVAT